MKKFLTTFTLVSFLICVFPLAETGCTTAPDQRTQTVTTLKIVGTTAKASIDASAQLLKEGKISITQWVTVSNFYDQQFQPAFNLAVVAAHSDLSSVASPDLLNLAAQLATMVSQLTAK